MSLGSSVEDEDSPLVFLEKVHQLRERVAEFMEAPLPSPMNLCVSPRAAQYLQQNWPAVTVRSLEDAPVPKVSCCSRCGGGDPEARSGSERRWCDGAVQEHQPLSSAAAVGVLLLLLLLTALWANPVGGATLGFSLLSHLSQLVHGLSSELLSCVRDSVGSGYAAMQAAVETWGAHLCSLAENVQQQLDALCQRLELH